MALAVKAGKDVLPLAQRAVQLVKDLGDDGEEPEHLELRERRREAEAATAKSPTEALMAAVIAVEQMLVASIKPQVVRNTTTDGETMGSSVLISGRKAHLIKKRLREILWVVKDALGHFKDLGDNLGKGIALRALARVHLSRSDELDAPMAAVKCAKEAVTVLHSSGDVRSEAEALRVACAAHATKAGLSPYEKVVDEENDRAIQAVRQAVSLFKRLGDKKGQAQALQAMGSLLLGSDDEDNQLEAERHIQDAVDLFKEIKERDLECNAMMSMVTARIATSGPEQAVLFAKDCAADFHTEGDRPKHEATALHAAAEINLSIGELQDAFELCRDALRIFNRTSTKKGAAGVLQTMFQVANAKGDLAKAIQTGEEACETFRDLGDRRGEGSILASIADMLFTKLCLEVKQDTEAATAKKDPPIGLTPDEVSKRAEEALDYANRGFVCFEEIDDEPGMAEVQGIIQSSFQSGVDAYCTATEPDRIYTTLEVNGAKEKESVLEWSVDFPHAKRLMVTG